MKFNKTHSGNLVLKIGEIELELTIEECRRLVNSLFGKKLFATTSYHSENGYRLVYHGIYLSFKWVDNEWQVFAHQWSSEPLSEEDEGEFDPDDIDEDDDRGFNLVARETLSHEAAFEIATFAFGLAVALYKKYDQINSSVEEDYRRFRAYRLK